MGHEVLRIGHVKALVSRLAAGERWDLVFNICEGVRGMGREAQVPALLDAFDVPYVFSGPVALGLTLDKALTKHVVQNLGIPTPRFALVRDRDDLGNVALPFPLFVKPNGEGTGKGVSARSRVETPEALTRVSLDLLERFRQPVLVETYLPGREFTTGIVGCGRQARTLGTMEVHFTSNAEGSDYSYLNKADYETRIRYTTIDPHLAEQCERVALAAWRGLDCHDGGRVDLRMDSQGRVNFIEVNPLPGLNPDHSDLPILCRLNGTTYSELIREIFASALTRLNLGKSMPCG
ncbi:MAG: hypothetical protein QM784_26325 [Polyangiaceae bacterium]